MATWFEYPEMIAVFVIVVQFVEVRSKLCCKEKPGADDGQLKLTKFDDIPSDNGGGVCHA